MVQTASVFSMLEICQMLLLACLLAKGKEKRNQSTHTHTLVLENTSILIWGRVLDLHAKLICH